MTSRGISHADLIGVIPAVEPDQQAIERAVYRLPGSLLNEYFGKLSAAEQRTGTLHELRVIGKLLRPVGHFMLDPYPAGMRIDAQFKAAAVEAELEITALVTPAYNRAIQRVCRRVESHLARAYPDHAFDVGIGNMGNDFKERSAANGSVQLDEDALFQGIVEALESAIDVSGNVGSGWTQYAVRSPVVTIRPAQATSVRQCSYRLPAGTHIEQAKRKVLGKIAEAQWSGKVPAILAVVLQSHPDARILNEAYDSVCDAAFATLPHLAAIVGLPFGNPLSRPTVYYPVAPGPSALLSPECIHVIERAFRFWVGIEWRWGRWFCEETRRMMRRDGKWPGWRHARLA